MSNFYDTNKVDEVLTHYRKLGDVYDWYTDYAAHRVWLCYRMRYDDNNNWHEEVVIIKEHDDNKFTIRKYNKIPKKYLPILKAFYPMSFMFW